MSIHAALGHRIQILEHRCADLMLSNGVARKAIEDLLSTLDGLFQDDPTARERYAPVVDFARKALGVVETD